ncbi:UDP-3-O-(3-hydroxymyristoyl)glucosamine N-acyltransferase [Cupriavidus yeoncheonensis]|uniref:UDP-3-O-(3-hydroxymyristoyl)glucosamine N-acyltransferase n=1 Tax=Cupriavidus yeoncheonensis TaxID=1462994 RepID=A0A916IVE9_9BURK|nr:acetyltransferase [Cupriavidus yeoncheonensis]CAG2146112.1 UDP-3-O-(3-hydroxymyristoyl)glucosamine N-acyltransferase [Cupriavidus yeoncheonensis]
MPLLHAPSLVSVVIAGAGGLGLELYDYLSGEALPVAGFIDDTPGKVPDGVDLPNLGPIRQFTPAPHQGVMVAIGSPAARRDVLSWLIQRGTAVPSYVHATALVSPSSRLGVAALIFPFTVVSRDASVEDGVVANAFCGIGHGAYVGPCSVLSPHVVLNGNSAVGPGCFLGTRATLYPGVRIGAECTVDSHTGVSANVKDRQFITSGAYQIASRRIRDE